MKNRTVEDFRELARKIGPLRYQMSEKDCVPVTIINALLVMLGERLSPKLAQFIWTIGTDRVSDGTGWTASRLLSDLLNVWSKHAPADDYGPMVLCSKIVDGEKVHLRQNNSLVKCLNSGGVACITSENGAHYVLLLARKEGNFLGFDPWWCEETSENIHSEEISKYHGMVNFEWEKEKMEQELSNEKNKWIQLIHRMGD